MSEPQTPDQLTLFLRQDFRHHLEEFYSQLHLAPPYNSVEKAIRFLSASLQNQTDQDRERLANNSQLKWTLFTQAFIDSGLPNKHRGIIRGLLQSNQCSSFPSEYSGFLKPFLSNP